MNGLSLLVFVYWIALGHSGSTDSRCEPMRIPWCMGGYSEVIFPNFFGHKTQEEAYSAMHKLWPLIRSKCSADIVTYLCRLYAPQCPYLVRGRDAEYVSYYQPDQAKPPCEEACLRVKKECQRVLNEHGLEWPPELECHRLRHKDCYQPTVEVRPKEVASKGRIDWEVETASTYRPTPRSWQPPTRPTTTMATATSSTKTPPATSKQQQVVYQTLSTTNQPPTRNQVTSASPKSTTVKTPKPGTTPSVATSPVTAPGTPVTTQRVTTGGPTRGRTTQPPTLETTTRRLIVESTARPISTTTVDIVVPVVVTKAPFVDSTNSGENKTRQNSGTSGTSATVRPGTTDWPASVSTTPISQESNGPPQETPKHVSHFRASGEVSSDEIRFYPSYEPSSSTCEPLATVPSCQNLGYNMTSIDEETQNLAAIQIFYFSPLIREVKCSDYLEAFLCAAYVPPCKGSDNGENVLPPCRSFCQSARNDCEELIEKLGFRWPEELECDKYPTDSDKCIASLSYVEEEDEDESLMPPPGARPAAGIVESGEDASSLPKPPIPPAPAPSKSPHKPQAASGSNATIEENSDESVCEPVIVQGCQSLPAFNSTRYPNSFGHNDQFEAGVALREFQPLIDVGCSSHIRLFLCSLYVPPCPSQPSDPIILPCRSLCELVKSECYPLLRKFGFAWPVDLNCSKLPIDQASSNCIVGPASDQRDQVTSTTMATSTAKTVGTEAKTRALVALRDTAPLNPLCQKHISSSFCNDLYETTFYPNLLSHARQEEAEFEMRQFKPIIASNCSRHLKSFLCSIYAPRCTVLDYPVPPCRHVCVEAKRGCESVMNSFGFRWPSHFNCSQYPAWESEELCWHGAGESSVSTTTTAPVAQSPPAITDAVTRDSGDVENVTVTTLLESTKESSTVSREDVPQSAATRNPGTRPKVCQGILYVMTCLGIIFYACGVIWT